MRVSFQPRSPTGGVAEPAGPVLPRYVPLLDPDHFHDGAFFEGLAAMGYRWVLLGGTGGARMRECAALIRARAPALRIINHPSSPGDVCPADLVFLPAVMNTSSHFARPFGAGAVSCAMAVAEMGLEYLPVAFFVMGDSTVRWYAEATPISSKKLVVAHCLYAQMLRFEWVFLDYEGSASGVDPALIDLIRRRTSLRLMISDEFSPESARAALERGAHTIVTPSNVYERHASPLELARRFYDALLAG